MALARDMDLTAFVGGYGVRLNSAARSQAAGLCGRRSQLRRTAIRMSDVEVSLPDSLQDSMERAAAAYRTALERGYRRVAVEIDLAVGDETYTMLKNTLPMIRAFLGATFENNGEGLLIVFPDEGTAAMVKRDWEELSNARLVGFGRVQVSEEDKVVLVVSPRASESEALVSLCNKASPLFKEDARPMILFNPDLVDMGVTGMSLTARQLRENVIDTFETTFYLRTLPWGAVYRCYPSQWTIWKDDGEADGGFRILESSKTRPTGEELDDALIAATPEGEKADTGGFFAGLKRFLSIYSRG